MWPVLLAACAADTAARGALGYALTFDGRGTDIASAQLPGEIFRGATGLTMTGWFRAFGMIGPPYRTFALTLTTPQSSNWLHPLVWELGGQDYSMDIFDTTIHQPGDARLQMTEFERWRHFAVAWGPDGGHLRVYLDGVLAVNRTQISSGYNISEGASQGVYLGIGVYAFNPTTHVPTNSFRGSLDNLQLWTHTLTPTQIQADFETLGSSDELPAPSLKFTFDDGPGNTSANYGTAANVHLQFGADPDGSLFFDADDDGTTTLQYTSPVWTPSDLPLNSSIAFNGLVVHTFLPGRPALLSLIALTPRLRITSLPSHGALLANGTLLAIGAEILTEAPVYFVSNTTALAAFTYVGITNTTASTSNTTVHLLPETPPHVVQSPPRCTWPRGQLLCDAQPLRATTREDTPVTIFLIGRSALGSDRTTAVIVRAPVLGTLYQLIRCCEALPGNFGAVIHDGDVVLDYSSAVAFVPARNAHGAGLANLTFYVNDSTGLISEPATFTIDVQAVNDVPILRQPNTTETSPLTPILLRFEAIDVEGDRTTLALTRQPAHGQTYLDEGGEPGRAFSAVSAVTATSQLVTQLAADVVAASSFWTGSVSWHPLQAIGAQDTFEYGDSELAWSPRLRTGDSRGEYIEGADSAPITVHNVTRQFSFSYNPSQTYELSGYTEFIEVKFEEEVFATALRIGENRGMCSVVRIQGRSSTRGDSFVDLWVSDESAEDRASCWAQYDSNQRYRVFAPVLCQLSISVDVLRIELDTRSVSDWNEIDFVELTGTRDLIEGVFPANTSSLWYVPDRGFVGEDSLQLTGYACAFRSASSSEPLEVPILVSGSFPPPSPPASFTVPVVRLGILSRMFGTVTDSYVPFSSGASIIRAVVQALREINNKTDGVADHLLPHTTLQFAYQDSRCDAVHGLRGALHLVNSAFGGRGVSAIIGAYCSDASVAASYVAGASSALPLISPATTTPAMSNGIAHPSFLRTIASDAFQAEAIIDVLLNVLNYTAVAMLSSSDAYGVAISDLFRVAAFKEGLSISVDVVVTVTATTFDDQYDELRASYARVIVALCQVSVGSRILSGASSHGLIGPGYLWFGGDALASQDLWLSSPSLLVDEALRLEVLRGFFGVGPRPGRGELFDEFRIRRRKLLVADESIQGCSQETDDDGTQLWARDHDENSSTPRVCIKNDPNGDFAYDGYAYDAAFAVAHALHDLIEVQNRSEVVAPELLATLIERVSFEGVTGLVDFYDASANPNRIYQGDRRVGIWYDVLNYVDNTQALVTVGSWTPCSGGDGCSWSEQWHPVPGVGLTFSTADNRPPPQAAPQRIREVRIGVLLPMFGTATAGLSRISWSPLVGVYQALREINNKSDGVADGLLPHTHLKFAFFDSKCDSAQALQGALHLTQKAFGGDGVNVIVGSGCSAASVTAAQVTTASAVPLISGASTSPTLSDGKGYPFFLRTIPSDSFGAIAIVNMLQHLWNYTSVALAYSTDAYGAGLSDALLRVAAEQKLTIRSTVSFVKDAIDFSLQHRTLIEAGSRVIVLLSLPADASRFMRQGLEVGIGGEGYLWISGDASAQAGLWEDDPILSTDADLRLRVLKGSFAVLANPRRSSEYEAYMERQRRLPPNSGTGLVCNLERDDDGTYLWAQDHDGNASTPLECAGHDLSIERPFDSFTFDAVFAVAHALHDLIEVQNRTEIVGSELLDTMIKRVRFEGVTGLVDFYDASADPDRRFHGDRRVGVSYNLLNYMDNVQGLVNVGLWTPCSTGSQCSWSDQWTPSPGVVPVYSTSDNQPPPQFSSRPVYAVRLGVLLPSFETGDGSYISPCGVSGIKTIIQALREINNKTDGEADHLLPHTTLQFAYQDSRCDAVYGLKGALHLATSAFGSRGVSAIIGAYCSDASVAASYVAGASSAIPLISPASTSPAMSDGIAHPSFLRTVASGTFQVEMMIGVLQNVLNYTAVAMLSSSDAYGVAISGAFRSSSFRAGLSISVDVLVALTATTFDDQYDELRASDARVIVALTQLSVGSRFLSGASSHGLTGPGYLWFGGDALATSALWLGNPTLLADEALRLEVLRGFFGVSPRPGRGELFEEFQIRRRNFLIADESIQGCSQETDSDGTQLWAQDHDENSSTPRVCIKIDPNSLCPYDGYAYDAAFAVAHALHDLIQVQNRSEVVAPELLATLIERVSFEGVTGLVDFYDASANPNRIYQGDRRVGIWYDVLNYVDNTQALVTVGSWTPCSGGDDCSWSEQWHPVPGVGLTFSTADNRPPPQAAPQRIREVRIGVLLPMFGTATAGLSRISWSPLVGVYQALHEINNKSDGVADALLPHTHLKFAFFDSKCDSAQALQGALHLTQKAFGGNGVSMIFGAGCSSASVTAAQVATGSLVPLICGASTSPTLSDGKGYPFFLRTIPSDAFGAVAIVSMLQRLWNYTSVALAFSTDAYGAGIAEAFTRSAFESNLEVTVSVSFVKDAIDFSSQHRALLEVGNRVIVLLCLAGDAIRFMRSALEAGIGGDGYIWVGGDTLVGNWEDDAILSTDANLRLRVLKGSFAIIANGRPQASNEYQGYLARRRRLPPNSGTGDSCDLGTDDDGAYLWAQDHDANASTPLACAGYDLSQDGPYDSFGFDAVSAIAHALHDLIEVQNRTEIVGSELLDTMIKRVRFEGVTGLVDFYDASADPDRRFHGDRRVGVSYNLLNYVDNVQKQVNVGLWTPCSTGSQCSWSDQWTPSPGVVPVYSTGGNTPPSQSAFQVVREVRLGVLLQTFGTSAANFRRNIWSPLFGVYHALLEINNKTDGVADGLLPKTTLKMAYRDSKCASSEALQASLHLTREAFDGKGVNAIIGADCSEASITAAQVAAGSHVPMISPGSTSVALSDGRKYPFFLRTIPADSMSAHAMVEALTSLFNYTKVALVHSTDAYGSDIADEFVRKASALSLTILTIQRYANDAADFESQQLALRLSGARVIVLYCQASDCGRFMRTAWERDVGGEGYVWCGGDALASPELWENDDILQQDESLRDRILKGLFAFSQEASRNSSEYQGYLARRRRLPPNAGTGDSCNLERDDDGAYLWAQDHDANASTPLECAGYDLSQDGPYDAFGFDAVFAIAHALHHLIEVENRTEIVGSELLDTMIKRVRFEGVTGLVDFYDASADPDRRFHGDRRVGVSYKLLNYVDKTRGQVVVGLWTPCYTSSEDESECNWSDQWAAAADVELTFSTADNRKPQQTAGVSCPYGEVLSYDGSSCVCDDGFEREPSGTRCRRCENGLDSRRATHNQSDSAGCTMCAKGFYRQDRHLPAASCIPCDGIQGVTCDSNATIETLNLNVGYWRLSGFSLETSRCASFRDRNNGSLLSPCHGGTEAGDDGLGYCRSGHSGPRCELCIDSSQYFSRGDCIDCPEPEAKIWLILGLMIGGVVLIFGLYSATRRFAPRRYHAVSHWLHRADSRLSTLAMIPKLKLAIAFLQTMRLLPEVYELRLPTHYFDWMEVLQVFEFDWSAIILPTPCLERGYFDKLLIQAVGPIVLVAAIVIIRVSAGVAPFLLGFKAGPAPWRKCFLSVLPVLCFVAVVLTPSTATNIFAAWSCETFQLESIATPPTSVKLLRGDLSLICDQSNAAYVRVLVLAYVLVAIWPIGVPTICLMTLYLHRRPILHGQSTRVVRATSFLFREYDKAYYWWEVLFLVQRLCIVGFAQWLSHSIHRILFGLIVASAFMALQLAVQPYKRSDVGIMAYSSQGATVLFLFVSMFIRQFNVLEGIYFNDTQRTDSLSYQLLGFSSINSLVATLIAVVFTFLTVFVVLTCYHMVTGQDISILRLTATSYPPELSLDKGKRYHLFLSHIWSSGQDQVANIKRKLQLMVPGCQIFLDVDDLDQLASLEKHVESSQCVLTFLSKGYFYSANCRREITCAFHHNIPLALVHEADVAKGGVSLETLRLDCESACPEQRELFDHGREIIVWHRMADFQQLSLKRIAKTMLQATPLYRELESPPELYLSAELENQVLEFRHPVHLYVSQANRGALQIAESLVERQNNKNIRILLSRNRAFGDRQSKNMRYSMASPRFKRHSQNVENMRQAGTLTKKSSDVRWPREPSNSAARTSTGGDAEVANISATHMLLYLNTDTFLGVDGQTLANDVRLAWAAGVEVVLVHENDEHLCGCPFSRFFETTPQELVQDGLYKRLAVPFQPSPYREISQALLALALGARLQRSKAAQVADGIKKNSLVKRFTQKALSMRPTMRGSRSLGSRWSV